MSETVITIITPCFNRVKLLPQTVKSVGLQHGSFSLDYIIVDGASSDGTIEWITGNASAFSKFISEPDEGMYHALNKGFSISSGQIMGWINSDDLLLPGALENVIQCFRDNTEVNWLTGLSSCLDETGKLIRSRQQIRYDRLSFLAGQGGSLQQESTFWRRSLWEKAGAKLDCTYRYAADFELWCRFFKYAELYHIDLPLGAFRRHGDQLSSTFHQEYQKERSLILKEHRKTLSLCDKARGMLRSHRINSTLKTLQDHTLFF